MPAHDQPDDAYTVSTIYESCDEPMMNEAGYEVQVARLDDGQVHSLVVIDHETGNMVEVPPEVALAMAAAISGQVHFPPGVLH